MTDSSDLTPADVDAIAARAKDAPGGRWEAFADRVWIPWFADTDDEPATQYTSGRWIAIAEGSWHSGSEDPPPGLWQFLAAARDDVLNLAAEVRQLRARLADGSRQEAA